MPTVKTSPGIAVVDGIIYVIGGFGDSGVPGPPWLASSIVYAYDPATDEWTKKADMPTARLHIGVCVIDGQIYVSGGLTKWDLASGVPTVEIYDPATDTWTQASDMPWVRHRHSASVVAGKIYIIGGAGEALQLFSTVDMYDPAAGAWTTAADFPIPRAVAATAVVDGRIYAIGGASSPEAPPISIVEEYDPGLPDNISVANPAGKLLGTWGEVKSE
jgi:N-acetylneuraminic acid mutarotase